ncbi:1-deoxy-D-xylulose-5-phosphate reductoisomerase [Malonomonas rubra]|uniref:1-deoxy-D-xylulose-5-phosphate reductoisomerase n=1 Tax=Malonomonas rubra TaxID=57040 RepID=UPI0026E98C5E|nr:1-deoxy-D-xylulose-5-phosphate reductoisomerase [Malonomonas rubra]
MKNLTILGSTGSIGVSTLQIIEAFPDRYKVVALSAGKNIDLLLKQVERFRPKIVAVATEQGAERLSAGLKGLDVQIVCGIEGLIQCATCHDAQMVVAAIVGAAGLVPTMAAIKAGKDVALANKETLVAAGSLVMAEVERQGCCMIPVDSEHSAIFQSLAGQRKEDIRRLILTASGGPFRKHDLEQLSSVTPADALAHPNWDMGQKISIDSATMMNKGLEVIEAHWLFGVPGEQIAVHIHPESIVHSMVEYWDGAVIAQLGVPDMKTPIAYALSWPQRLPLEQKPLSLTQAGSLTFAEPDLQQFPCLRLAYEAMEVGGSLPAVMNAANEVAVEAFLQQRISFLGIPELIEAVMKRHHPEQLTTIDRVLQADLWGRQEARNLIDGGLK